MGYFVEQLVRCGYLGCGDVLVAPGQGVYIHLACGVVVSEIWHGFCDVFGQEGFGAMVCVNVSSS